MEEVAKEIPPDEIVEPRSSVAGHALEGLVFAHDEPDPESTYLGLLRAAMDGRTAEVDWYDARCPEPWGRPPEVLSGEDRFHGGPRPEHSTSNQEGAR